VRFQEALTINPAHLQAAEYVKLAQDEEQKLLAAKTARRAATRVVATNTVATPVQETTGTTATEAPASTTAHLTTVFSHPFTDGRIVVRAGSDIVANERLFDERPARFLRRASRTPKPVSVTKEFPAKNADVQVWVTVPAAQIQEHHTLTGVRFEPGTQHRLTVRYDAARKAFTYEIN
jgi:hypothetical protein